MDDFGTGKGSGMLRLLMSRAAALALSTAGSSRSTRATSGAGRRARRFMDALTLGAVNDI